MEIDLNELVVGTHSVNPIIIRAGVSFKLKVPSYSRGRKVTNSLEIIFVDGKVAFQGIHNFYVFLFVYNLFEYVVVFDRGVRFKGVFRKDWSSYLKINWFKIVFMSSPTSRWSKILVLTGQPVIVAGLFSRLTLRYVLLVIS
jgi:hypothetical protein